MMAARLPPWALTAFNILGFQAVWLLCVYGAGTGRWLPGLFAALLFAALTLLVSRDRKRDLRTLAIALPIGFVMDSLLAQSPYLDFASPYPWANWAPAWIMALWIGFALTLNHSLKSIYLKALPTFLFGLLGGPLAYGIASQRFGAMSVESDILSCVVLVGLVWGGGLSLIRWIDLALVARKGLTA
jgi:Protein of unknown function (DUF2878)